MANSKTIGVAYSDPALDGGTIDNTVIGGTTKAAGSFTTLIASTAVNFNGSTAVSAATTVSAVATSVLSSGFGASTSANALALFNAVNSILTCLKDAGLMKS